MGRLFWVLLGLVIGCGSGWYLRGLAEPEVRSSAAFLFVDKLADPKLPYLKATGSWRGANLANQINTVEIICDGSLKSCDLHQADVMSLSGQPWLSSYSKSFRITKLDAQSAIAEALPDVCIRQVLTFDRVAQAVTMVRTKINRDDICSMVQDEPLAFHLREPLR